MKAIALCFIMFIGVQAVAQVCGLGIGQSDGNIDEAIEARYVERVREAVSRGDTGQLRVPVIIHLIHPVGVSPGTGGIPSIQEIEAGLQQLNAVWNGRISCGFNLSVFSPDILFCPAQRDITGNGTSGIETYASDLFVNLNQCSEESVLKEHFARAGRFPTTDYLNIYLVREICAPCSPYDCDIGGYASYAGAHGTAVDGIVVEYRTWSGISEICNLSTTLHHELGHYFNLLHTFAGGCRNMNCLEDGDRVCDTPPDNYRSIFPDNPCLHNADINSCATDAHAINPENPYTEDVADLGNNLMDYAPPACAETFTEGQVNRMRWTLKNIRGSLLHSQGCQPPCDPMIPLSTVEVPGTVVFPGPITIQNTSPPGYTYVWLNNGKKRTTRDFSYIPDTSGYYLIGLTSPDMDASCRDTLRYSVQVTCEHHVSIVGYSGLVEIGQELQWSVEGNQSGDSISWYVDDQFVSTGETFQYTVDRKGQISIGIQVCRDGCCATSDRIWISTTACPTGKEGTHWIFGDRPAVHLIFGQNGPTEKDITTDFFGYEGNVTQSDRYGNVQFTSDGDHVYNKNNELMATSYGRESLTGASPSTTQMVSVPWPGRDSMYFLFYSEQFYDSRPAYDTTTQLHAAIIDMRRNNGLGEVLTDSITLFSPSTEKVNAVRHCNGRDWWVLSTRAGTHELYAYLVDTSGIHRNPVVSELLVKQGFMEAKLGELIISPSGKKVLILNLAYDRLQDDFSTLLEIGYFNCNNGIYNKKDSTFLKNLAPYAGAFSSDEKYVYFGANLNNNGDNSGLFQVSIEHLESVNTIRHSDIYQYNNLKDIGGIELGPDGKIYFIRSLHGKGLGSIEYPDRPRQAAQVIPPPERLQLEFGILTLNLPTFPSGTHHPGQPYIRGSRMYCDTLSEITYTVGPLCIPRKYNWEVRGESRILWASVDSLVLSPSYETDTLIYTRTTGCATLSDTMIITPTSCSDQCAIYFQWRKRDTLICPGNDVFLTFSSNAVFSYVYPSGKGMPVMTVESGIIHGTAPPLQDSAFLYYLHLELQEGCDTLIPFTVELQDSLIFMNFHYDSLRCAADSIQLSFQTNAAHRYLINAVSGNTIPLPKGGIHLPPAPDDSCYIVVVMSLDSSCVIDTTFCTRIAEPILLPVDSMKICNGDSVLWRGRWVAGEGIVRDTADCDSIFSLHLSSYPAIEPTRLRDTSCQYSIPGIDTMIYSSVRGCDSLVIIQKIPREIYIAYDSVTTCDSMAVGIDSTFLSHPMGCDTLLITEYTYAAILITVIEKDTCSTVEIPTDSLLLTSELGCDSLVIIRYNTTSPDTVYQEKVSCEKLENDTTYFTNVRGCDSIVITEYTALGIDTTYLDSLVCVPRPVELIHVENRNGCDSVVIISYHSSGHYINLPAVVEIRRGDTITIPIELNFVPQSIQWNVTDGIINFDSFTDSLKIVGIETFLYRLELADANGCKFSAAIQVVVNKPNQDIYIPTAFTPNGDGVNDVFRAYFGEEKPETIRISIYDRWGARIYSSVGTDVKWDGMHRDYLVTPGVYSYVFWFTMGNGETVIKKGTVTVLR